MNSKYIFLFILPILLFSCVRSGDGGEKSSLQSFTSIKAGTKEAIAAQKELFPTFHALSVWYQEFEVENSTSANLVKGGWISDTWGDVKDAASEAGDAISETASELTGDLQEYFENSKIGALKSTSDSDPKAKQRFIDYLTKEENNSYAFLDAISKDDSATVVTLLEKDTKEMKDVIGVLLNPNYEMETDDVFATLIKEGKGDEFIDIFAEKFLEGILIKHSIKTILDRLEKERLAYFRVLKDNYTGSADNLDLLKTDIEENLVDILRLKKAILGDSANLVAGGAWDNIKATFEADKINQLSVWDRIKGNLCGGISFISGWSKSLFAKDKARQTNLGGNGVSPWGKPDLHIYNE